jgi:hypothetical protein
VTDSRESGLPSVVFYISGHGFGHASRVIEVIDALGRRRPDLRVVVRTSAARALFDLTLRHPVAFHEVACDTGVVQVDSLRPDIDASIRRAAEFHRRLDEKAREEASFLRAQRAGVVVGDIPPLAFAAAAAAGVPSVAFGNFTWDWIYEGYPEALEAAPDLVPTIRRAYSTAALALRLPMFGGFEGLERVIRDMPLVARHSRRDPTEVRRGLGLPGDRPLVLLSFGGYGLAGLDTKALGRLTGYTVVTTDSPSTTRPGAWAPSPGEADGGLIRLSERALYEAGFRYEDLVHAADVVVTKPGYGILAEAIANHTAILYTSRGPFAEYDVLVRWMPRYLRCRFIDQPDLLAGQWGAHLDALLRQPPPPETPATDGAQQAAKAIGECLN